MGKAIKDIDPDKENVLTCVNFGRGLPRAVVSQGVPVTSVGDLDNYGLMTGIAEEERRNKELDIFKRCTAGDWHGACYGLPRADR